MICDLAETYGIFNYEELSPRLVSTLVIGLRDNSRVKRKLSNSRLTFEESMLVIVFDALQAINYKLGHRKGQEKPKSLYKKINEEKKKDDLMTFNSPEMFENWRKEHLDG